MAGVLLVTFVIGTISLAYLLRTQRWALPSKVSPLHLALILLLSMLDTALYTMAVYILVRFSSNRVTLSQAYLVLTSSLSASYVTPVKLGIPLRIYLYKRVMQIPLATGTMLVALETWLGMLVPVVIASLGISTLFPEIGLITPLAFLSLLLAAMVATLVIKPSQVNSLLARLPFRRITRRLVHFGDAVQAGLRSVSIWRLGIVVLLFSLNFVVGATRLYVVLLMMGWTINWPAALAILAISITAGNLSMIPMGLGVRDTSLTVLLMQLGVPNEIALSAAVIQRLLSPGWPLLLGIISLNILGIAELVKESDGVSITQIES